MAACSPTPVQTIYSRSIAWTTSSGITSSPVVTTVTWHSTSAISSCVLGNKLLSPPMTASTLTSSDTETEMLRPTRTPQASINSDEVDCGLSEEGLERTSRTSRENDTIWPTGTSRWAESGERGGDDCDGENPSSLPVDKTVTATTAAGALIARQRWRGGGAQAADRLPEVDDEPSCSWVTSQAVVTNSRLSTSWFTWTTLASSSMVTSVPISTGYQECSSSKVMGIMHEPSSSLSASAASASAEASPLHSLPTTLTLQASPTPVDALTLTTNTQPSTTSSISSGVNATPLLNTDDSSTTSSKGVAAGAAVGGVLGLLILIGVSVCVLLKIRRQRHENRTAALRSSWFYGGDARLSEYEHPCHSDESSTHDDNERSEKETYLQQSRFSAPSIKMDALAHVSTRGSHRFSNAAIAFLTQRIANLRQSGGRFPSLGSMRHTLGASFFPRASASQRAWAGGYDPSSMTGAACENGGFPTLRSVQAPQAQHPILRAHEPGIESIESQEASVDWGHSYSSSTSSMEHRPQVFISSPSTASPASALIPTSNDDRPTEPDRPWPYNLHHLTTRNSTPHAKSQQPSTPMLFAADASAFGPSGTWSPPHSTLFEFASYDLPRDPSDHAGGSSESLATTQSASSSHDRQTRDWYEKALWDGGSYSTMSRYSERITVYTFGEAEEHAYSGLERGLSTKNGDTGQRKSVARKEVRWDQ